MKITLEGYETYLNTLATAAETCIAATVICMAHARLRNVIRWEDGVPYKTILTVVDRWKVQNSDTVTVSVSKTVIIIKQQVCPRFLCRMSCPVRWRSEGHAQ